jgi:hypothetical protein
MSFVKCVYYGVVVVSASHYVICVQSENNKANLI